MFDKITARVRKLCYGLNDLVDPIKISMRVIEGIYDGVTTSELDNLAAEIAATLTTTHPDFAKVAARIAVFIRRAVRPSLSMPHGTPPKVPTALARALWRRARCRIRRPWPWRS